MKTKILSLSLLIVLFSFYSCTKKIYTIEEPEEPAKNNVPGIFEISVTKVTDHDVAIQWGNAVDPDGDILTYEVALNDSVIAYDITLNQYTISKLQPDKEYRISVIALDPLRNSSKTEKIIKTQKSFLKEIFQFDLNYDKFQFYKVIKTSDSGTLILGRGTLFERSKPYKYFLLKLRSDYSIDWKKEYDWELSGIDDPINLHEISGEGYFLVDRQKIVKIDYQGNSVVLYEVPADYNVFALRAIESDMNGNYLIVGESVLNWQASPVCTKYFLVKINGNGSEMWHKFGGNTIVNYPSGIFRTDKNRYMIVGVAESTKSISYDNNHDWKRNFWILNIDGDGHELSEQIFTNKYMVEDVLVYYSLENDGSFIMAGAAAGFINGGGSNDKARFIKINADSNALIWDSYPDLESYGIFCRIDCADKIQDNGGYLVLASDDRGASLSEFSNSGDLNRIVKLMDYPRGLFVKYNPLGYYEYITADGFLIIFNRDGYHE
jgi:hypothetical protein